MDEENPNSVQVRYIKQFKEELMNYKKTRHDNVELFLGLKTHFFILILEITVLIAQIFRCLLETAKSSNCDA